MSSASLNKLKKPATTHAAVTASTSTPLPPGDDDAIMIDMEPLGPLPDQCTSGTKPQEGEDSLMRFGEVKEQKSSKGLTQTAKVSNQIDILNLGGGGTLSSMQLLIQALHRSPFLHIE